MLSPKRILKDYTDSGAFNALVNIHAVVEGGVFLTKSGDLVTFVAIGGTESECFDAAQTDYRARRFESVMRIFDERFRLHQLLFKRENPALPSRTCDVPLAQKAAESRLLYLRTKGESLCSSDTYWSVVYEGWRPGLDWKTRFLRSATHPAETLRGTFSSAEKMHLLQRELAESVEYMSNRVASFVLQVSDFLDARRLGTQDAYGVLRRLVNYAPHKTDHTRLKYASCVDYQACDSSLECHRGYLRLDDYFVHVLTLKEPPGHTYANLLRGLVDLPGNAIIATEWKPETAQQARKLIQSKRRHFHNSKSSMMNFATSGSHGGSPDVLVDDGASALVGSLGGCLREIEVNGRSFGQFSATVVLYDKDLPRLRRTTAQCFKIAATQDAQLTEETYNRLNAFLAVVPGNSAHNLRRQWLLNSNHADLSFLYPIDTGRVTNDHLNTEYLAILEGRGHTPYFLNLHAKDIAHTLVLGSTGSGKSFLLNFLLTHAQKFKPLTYVFDLGGSYANLTRLFDGAYVPIGRVGSAVTINPFCLEPTKENLRFLYTFVKVLIESSGDRPSAEEYRDLFEQIENLYTLAPAERRLLTLSRIVHRHIRQALQNWVEGGPYGSVFDHAQDTLTFRTFQTFDFEGLENMPDQLEPLLFYVLHRAQASISDRDALTTLKLFVIDEGWRFFRNPVIKAYIVEALKTWRKKNAAMILATQSSDDLLKSDLLPVLVESCPTQIFLANPGMDRAAYQNAFHLNETEADFIAGLIPKRQFLFKQPGVSKRLDLNVDRKEYWIYTTTPSEVQRRQEAFERYGFDRGLEILTKETA